MGFPGAAPVSGRPVFASTIGGARVTEPAGDLAVQIELGRLLGHPERPSEKQVRDWGERWRPHRGAAAVLEIESHAAEGGWDQPARLFALVRTDALIAASL